MSSIPEAKMSVADAVGAIDRATAFTEPLRRRTEGVTIAVWGFVTAGVLLSNGVADDVYGFYHAGGWRRIVSSLLWMPWAFLGVLTTHALWRIAEVSSRTVVPGRRRSVGVITTWLAALLGAVVLIAIVPVAAPGFAIAIIGLIWVAVGALDIYSPTPAGRRTMLATGSIIAVTGVAYGVATMGMANAGWEHFTVTAALVGGLVPIVAGLSQALRG